MHLYAHADGSVVVRSAAKDGGALNAANVEIGAEKPSHAARALRAAHAAGFGAVTLTPATSFTDADARAVADVALRDDVRGDAP